MYVKGFGVAGFAWRAKYHLVDTPEKFDAFLAEVKRQKRIALDLEYVERQSFWLDLWIMAATAPLVLGDRSADR